MKTRITKCVVACTNANGTPDLFPIQIDTTHLDLDEGDHYEKAKVAAVLAGYEKPFVMFDEFDDAGRKMATLFEWEDVPVI